MPKNFIQNGDVITVTATGGGTAGGLWEGSALAGVIMETEAASASTTLEIALSGVFNVTKTAGASEGVSVGDKLYVASAAATKTSTSNPALGMAVEAAATGATSVKVRLAQF